MAGARSSPKGKAPMHSSKGWEAWSLEGWASLREVSWVHWQAWEQGGTGDWDPGYLLLYPRTLLLPHRESDVPAGLRARHYGPSHYAMLCSRSKTYFGVASDCHLCFLLLDPLAADSIGDRSINHPTNFSVCHHEPDSGDRAGNMTTDVPDLTKSTSSVERNYRY